VTFLGLSTGFYWPLNALRNAFATHWHFSFSIYSFTHLQFLWYSSLLYAGMLVQVSRNLVIRVVARYTLNQTVHCTPIVIRTNGGLDSMYRVDSAGGSHSVLSNGWIIPSHANRTLLYDIIRLYSMSYGRGTYLITFFHIDTYHYVN